MFSGLITSIGRVENLRSRRGGGSELTLRAANLQDAPCVGESIAVQGVCLTAKAVSGESIIFDILRETVSKANLSGLRPGDPVNLERALQAGDRLGGHLVSGHVDGQGMCASIQRLGQDHAVTIRASRELLAGMVVKGSIACDGISLTIAAMDQAGFTVHVIPHTWSATTFHGLRAGAMINLETDMLGKYAMRGKSYAGTETGGITLDKLRKSGFGF